MFCIWIVFFAVQVVVIMSEKYKMMFVIMISCVMKYYD